MDVTKILSWFLTFSERNIITVARTEIFLVNNKCATSHCIIRHNKKQTTSFVSIHRTVFSGVDAIQLHHDLLDVKRTYRRLLISMPWQQTAWDLFSKLALTPYIMSPCCSHQMINIQTIYNWMGNVLNTPVPQWHPVEIRPPCGFYIKHIIMVLLPLSSLLLYYFVFVIIVSCNVFPLLAQISRHTLTSACYIEISSIRIYNCLSNHKHILPYLQAITSQYVGAKKWI